MEKIIFKGIVGSQAFGTATPTSDVDIAEIYMCDNDDLLGFTYKEHDDLDKDYRRYELGKFIRLLMNGNPNACEILNLPPDCIIIETEEWLYVKNMKEKFVTKKLSDTFAGYAKTQINKARGLNKKANWEEQKVTRKGVMDFCYVLPYAGQHTQAKPLHFWLDTQEFFQEDCGLVKIDHLKDSYLVYVDRGNYLGIVRDNYNNNDVILSEVSNDRKPMGILYFNKDGYSTHCKDYNQYQQWLSERSEERFATNKKHGQLYDSKHIMHVVRLLKTARDIAENGIVVVRRTEEEIAYLLQIKRGEVDLKQLVDWAENEVPILMDLFVKSSLPEDVNFVFGHNLVVKLRTGNFKPIKKPTFHEYIVTTHGLTFYYKSLESMYQTDITSEEEWFSDLYTEWNILYNEEKI